MTLKKKVGLKREDNMGLEDSKSHCLGAKGKKMMEASNVLRNKD